MNENPSRPRERYQLILQGHLDPTWCSCLGTVTGFTEQPWTTILQTAVEDQAALHGLLTRIRDLGLTIESLRRIAEQERPAES